MGIYRYIHFWKRGLFSFLCVNVCVCSCRKSVEGRRQYYVHALAAIHLVLLRQISPWLPGWPTSELGLSPPQCWDYKCVPCRCFSSGSGGWTSGPTIDCSSTLLTELTPWPCQLHVLPNTGWHPLYEYNITLSTGLHFGCFRCFILREKNLIRR